jgi:beta-N-acetylhexosaminidase
MAATSSSGMTDGEARQLAALNVGSVLLLGNSTAGRSAIADATSSISRRVGSDHGVQVLLAADQEGGKVQRLAGPGFDTVPSARDQASLSDDRLRSDARRWGRQLKRAGITANLAPVSDVVPTSIGTANQPIGALQRGYGPDPDVVARKNVAFIDGMAAGGVATSVKHFPGLGIVRGNTDFSRDVTDDVTTRHDKRLNGFRAGVRTGVDMVMVSSAVYTKIDPDRPATFSRTVLDGMIRDDLGFRGVIISDDLLGKALDGTAVRRRALRFIRAGGDLSIVGQPDDVAPMIDAVRQAAADDPGLRSRIRDSATRILIMKARHGLADCTA